MVSGIFLSGIQKWLSSIGLHLYGKPSIGSGKRGVCYSNDQPRSGRRHGKDTGEPFDGSQMQGAGFLTKIRTILLPLLHNSSVSAVLAAFGGSVFNLAITTILYPPNYSTLPVYISDSYNDLKFGYAAAATIVGGAFIIGIMMILEIMLNIGYLGKGKRRK